MKQILLMLFIGGILGGIYLGYKQTMQKPNEEIAPRPSTTTVKLITMEEIAQHNNKDSCWFAIEGKVYDVTGYVASGFHPGKEAILMGCGKDATEIFNNRPNGSGSHSERARGFMTKYEIGELEK